MNYLLDIKSAFLPEIIMIAFIIINALFAMFANKKMYKTSRWITIFCILSAFCSIGFLQAEPTFYAFNNSILNNVYTVFFKCLILIGSFFVILMSFKMIKKQKNKTFEFFTILLSSVLCSLILTNSNDFLTAFIAFEFLNLNCCTLISFSKNKNTLNNSLKYLSNGFIASALFLLGVSYLYGITGTINFNTLSTTLLGYQGGLLYTFAVIMIILGLMIKTGLCSFGKNIETLTSTEYPTIMFIYLIPRIAGCALLSRLLLIFYDYSPILSLILPIIIFMSLLFNIKGLFKPTNVKDFYGYSANCQIALILILLSVPSIYNITGLLYCLIFYLIVNIAFCSGLNMFYNSTKRNDITVYKGLGYKFPMYSIVLSLILISLAGLAPSAGFWARFFIFSSIIRLGIYYLPFLIMAIILSIILMLAYFNFIKLLLEKNNNKFQYFNSSIFSKIILYFSCTITILLCFYSEKIIELCELIAYSL